MPGKYLSTFAGLPVCTTLLILTNDDCSIRVFDCSSTIILSDIINQFFISQVNNSNVYCKVKLRGYCTGFRCPITQ